MSKAISASKASRSVRAATHDLLHEVVQSFLERNITISEIVIVPLTIIARMIRIDDAIRLLLKHHQPAEAAVLSLTQFELRLALAHTAYRVEHSTSWLDHQETHTVGYMMKDRIDSLFKGAEERQRLYSIFKHLSGVKHGNPVYSELGFPSRISGRTVTISTGPMHDRFSRRFTKMLSVYSTYQLAWAAEVINVYVARYTKVAPELRRRVRTLCKEHQAVEAVFVDFLSTVADDRAGHLGVKAFKRKTPRPTATGQNV